MLFLLYVTIVHGIHEKEKALQVYEYHTELVL